MPDTSDTSLHDNDPVIATVALKQLVCCGSDQTVRDAAILMRRHSISSVLIVAPDNGRVCGIWTAADTRKLDFSNPGTADTLLLNVMSSPVRSVKNSSRLSSAAGTMLQHGIRRLLVEDPSGKPVGLLTQSDIVRQQRIEFYLQFRDVSSCINKEPLHLQASLPLSDAVVQMHQHDADAAVVQFGNGEQGILTEQDLIGFLTEHDTNPAVAMLATTPLISISANATLLQAVRLLTDNQLRHVAVRQDNRLIGLLSFNDILRNVEYAYVDQLRTALMARDVALRTSADYLRLAHKVIDASLDGIMITDHDGIIQSVNPSFCNITGYSLQEVVGQSPRLLSSGLHQTEFYRNMWQVLLQHGHWQGEIWNKRKNGELYPQWLTITAIRNEQQQISQFAAIFSDITERKQQEQKIHQLAYIDELTGLANRRMFFDRLQLSLANAHRHNHQLAVLFLDLDLFKRINDTLGHQAGDQALKEVARRISETVREGESVARLGGDEFTILLPEISQTDPLECLARRLIKQIEKPVRLLDQEFFLTTSIGIAVYPQDGVNAEQLVKHADVAMYQAKNSGRNQYCFYHASAGQQNVDELKLEQALREALRLQQLDVYYQPKFTLDSQQLVGLEALVRWQHPQLGVMSPALFIPLAEKLGLISTLGEQVLQRVCLQLTQWHNCTIPVSVNISALQLADSEFVTRLHHIIRLADVPPQRIELELTESCLIPEQAEQTQYQLTQLKALGFKLSIDDFGTGYSSLSYLRRLPIDTLKIDQSFVRDLPDNPGACQIVSAIIAMAKALGLDVIAEGIEHQQQLEFLRQAGCNQGQGYLVSAPRPAQEFAPLFKADIAESG
ncbi:EAL domain-containing protein [Rheinheimera aquimaris]|jgi:diguanylate cyclase (GGDEF)-like protein/PAS domain S-box-containing protein|uniref:EAL domain-containing protein n=1 Tax=Rheinheimera aquimaris TaxID=412437 RepID=UPI000E9EC5B5|nr:EAL domain-containing protein [Rheinheimera aquimaris]HBN90101.1 diguanylate cyclase [Rheinheimera sp.]|tara:strand:- start:888 stop:3416 length:2529 start_codon:yes stop_codon:yes gene_type:complete